MCLLMVSKPNALPSEKDLVCACSNNPDGFGYAIRTKDTIITGRGLDWEDVVERYYNARNKNMGGWAMFHARLATHGNVDKSNCHPFRVGGSTKTILAHNGILPIEVPTGESRSDTRLFAEVVFPKKAKSLDNKKWFKKLEKWASGNKIAIMSVNDGLKKPIYIVNESLGKWDNDGNWWSNDSYKFSYYRSYALSTAGYEDDWYDWSKEDSEELKKFQYQAFTEGWCWNCSHELLDQDFYYGECMSCLTCLECFRVDDECDCYRGSVSNRFRIEQGRLDLEWSSPNF